MPTFKITDNQTGKVVTVSGDTAPTEQQAEQIFKDAGLRKEKELGFGQKVVKGISSAAPTAGAVLGGLAGSLAGTFAGGIGAIPGGAIGTAAGTGAGLALGESLENLAGIQDETLAERAKESVVDPAVAGTLDLLTAGTVKVASKTLGPLGRALKGGAEGTYRVFVPKNAGTKAFASSFKTSSRIASELKPLEVADEMVKHGIYGDLDDLKRVADSVTGNEGAISKITRNAVGKIKGNVSINGALEAARKASKEATNIDPKVLNKIEKGVANLLSKNLDSSMGVGKINPLDALEAQRSLEDIGYSLLNKAQRSAGGLDALQLEQQAKIYLSASEEIANSIDNFTKGSIIDSFKSPEILKELEAISPRLKDQFLKAKTVSDIRAIAKPFVRMSKLVDATNAYSGSAFIEGLRGRGVGEVLTSALTKPEAMTSFAVAGKELAESPIGQGVQMAGQGIGKAGSALSKASPELMRILAQLGLSSTRGY